MGQVVDQQAAGEAGAEAQGERPDQHRDERPRDVADDRPQQPGDVEVVFGRRHVGKGTRAHAAHVGRHVTDRGVVARLGRVTRPLVPIPLARGPHGAVVAPHHLATEAGLSILRAGGSAVDAAIATNAVLAVVDGNACGIGGDAFWLIWDAAAGRQLALNGSGRSGARADAADLRRTGRTRLPLRGGLAITVPGAVRSWGDAHDRFGRLPRQRLLAPAIELAEAGFPAWDGFISAVETTVPGVRR